MSGEPGLRERLARLRLLPEPAVPEESWQATRALLGLLRRALAELKLRFAERGVADFTEVALAALEALGTPEQPSELLLRLDRDFHHILVDEFQDSSELQVELLERLTAGWQPGDGRSLFLVGDPMQSIYRFRKAEVGLFLGLRAAGRLGSVALTPIVLSRNFRSRPRLVERVNEVFARILPGEDRIEEGRARMRRAGAARDGEGEIAIRAIRPAPESEAGGGADEQAALAEACAWIEERRTSGGVAVLVRARDHARPLLRALAARGIPVHAPEFEPLGEQPLVADLAALALALSHPAERTAWLGVLRAPWCGLDQADLAALSASLQPEKPLWPHLVAAVEAARQSSLPAAAETADEALAAPPAGPAAGVEAVRAALSEAGRARLQQPHRDASPDRRGRSRGAAPRAPGGRLAGPGRSGLRARGEGARGRRALPRLAREPGGDAGDRRRRGVPRRPRAPARGGPPPARRRRHRPHPAPGEGPRVRSRPALRPRPPGGLRHPPPAPRELGGDHGSRAAAARPRPTAGQGGFPLRVPLEGHRAPARGRRARAAALRRRDPGAGVDAARPRARGALEAGIEAEEPQRPARPGSLGEALWNALGDSEREGAAQRRAGSGGRLGSRRSEPMRFPRRRRAPPHRGERRTASRPCAGSSGSERPDYRGPRGHPAARRARPLPSALRVGRGARAPRGRALPPAPRPDRGRRGSGPAGAAPGQPSRGAPRPSSGPRASRRREAKDDALGRIEEALKALRSDPKCGWLLADHGGSGRSELELLERGEDGGLRRHRIDRTFVDRERRALDRGLQARPPRGREARGLPRERARALRRPAPALRRALRARGAPGAGRARLPPAPGGAPPAGDPPRPSGPGLSAAAGTAGGARLPPARLSPRGWAEARPARLR
ncbi:MAG: UvrD-helicase domain-containing protein [Xanthomonadales bacterium]|nr:UvrD-helicase domain-containing protein [Xanthomonadales bacterium]